MASTIHSSHNLHPDEVKRRGGGIEPLHVSMPRELKSRPITSPAHPGCSSKHPKFPISWWITKDNRNRETQARDRQRNNSDMGLKLAPKLNQVGHQVELWRGGIAEGWRAHMRACAPAYLPGQAQHQDPLEPSPHSGMTEAGDHWATMRGHNRL